MFALMLIAFLQFTQLDQDFWVVTEDSPAEVSAINLGIVSASTDRDYVTTWAYTIVGRGSGAVARANRTYRVEAIAFRCGDMTFQLLHSSILSGHRDPIRTSTRDGPFVSVAVDANRQRQAEAVCSPRAPDAVGFPHLGALSQAYGLDEGQEPPARLSGRQPYPVPPGQRRAPSPGEPPNVVRPPRIGVDASSQHGPGSLLIGYSVEAGGRWITEFYWVGPWAPETASEPIVFVRRALDSWEAQEQIRWADSRTCPGLVAAMRPANTLALPTFIMPLDETSRTRRRDAGFSSPPGAAGHLTFWGVASGPVGSTVQFSTYGGPWVDWAQSVQRVLEPCWQDEIPSPPKRN